MRIATWNVNSLKARTDAVDKWLERADPDILLMQETKLSDEDAPVMQFRMAGYQLVHHGEGRWNGVAIAAREGLSVDEIVTNFGDGPVRDSSAGAGGLDEEDFDPFDEARMLSAVVEGIRMVALYAPNGRVVGSPFYEGKLRWFERVRRWLDETRSPDEPLILAGDYNVTPADEDVWDPVKAHGGTHVSEPERDALARLREWGLTDAYRSQEQRGGRFSWWDYRAGMFHRNEGMRIDLALRHRAHREARRLGRDRPRVTQGSPGPVRPCAGRRRPRREGHAVRCRLGRGARPDPGADEARRAQEPGAGPLREGAPSGVTARGTATRWRGTALVGAGDLVAAGRQLPTGSGPTMVGLAAPRQEGAGPAVPRHGSPDVGPPVSPAAVGRERRPIPCVTVCDIAAGRQTGAGDQGVIDGNREPADPATAPTRRSPRCGCRDDVRRVPRGERRLAAG